MIVPAREIHGSNSLPVLHAPVSATTLVPIHIPPATQPSLGDIVAGLGAFGLAMFGGYKATQWLTETPCDTYKYVHVVGGRIRHGGITNDLDRREREHRSRFRGGYIQQVGRCTTRSAALSWERRMGF